MEKYCYKMIIILGLLISGFVLAGCEEESGLVGVSVRPEGDDILVSIDSFFVQGGTSAPRGITTSDDDAYCNLGIYDDPIMGRITAGFMTQFSMEATSMDFGDDPIADSVLLTFYYKNWYGNPHSLNGVNVFRLDGPQQLDGLLSYKTNIDPTLYTSKSQKLGSIYYTAQKPGEKLASYLLRVPLDKSFAEELLTAPASVYGTDEAFRNFFKGVYLEPISSVGNSNILYCPMSLSSAGSAQAQSFISLYLTNEELLLAEDTLMLKVSSVDTIIHDTTRMNLDAKKNDILVDIEMCKNDKSWTINLVNKTKEARYTGSHTFEEITAREIKEQVIFEEQSSMSSTSVEKGDIMLFTTSNTAWVIMEVLGVGVDSLSFRRKAYVGRQRRTFSTSKGNAWVNVIEHDLSVIPVDTSGNYGNEDIYIKGMGALYGNIKLPKGRVILENNLQEKDGISIVNSATIELKVSEQSKQLDSIPQTLFLSLETEDHIPGMFQLVSSQYLPVALVSGKYIEDENLYRFSVPGYVQHLVKNPDEEPLNFIIKASGLPLISGEINQAQGVILESPKDALKVIFSEF